MYADEVAQATDKKMHNLIATKERSKIKIAALSGNSGTVEYPKIAKCILKELLGRNVRPTMFAKRAALSHMTNNHIVLSATLASHSIKLKTKITAHGPSKQRTAIRFVRLFVR